LILYPEVKKSFYTPYSRTGFPKGKKENQLDPLSIIVASCNAVDRLITFEGIAKNEAPKKLMIERVGMHPLNHIQLLSEVLKTLK